MRACAVVVVGIVSCGGPTEPPSSRVAGPVEVPPEPPPSLAAAPDAEREHVRALLEDACGNCHIGGSSAQPAALDVFDLREPEFAARMTDAQLEAMPDRVDGMGLEPDAAAAVLAYISVVLAERRAGQGLARDC